MKTLQEENLKELTEKYTYQVTSYIKNDMSKYKLKNYNVKN